MTNDSKPEMSIQQFEPHYKDKAIKKRVVIVEDDTDIANLYQSVIRNEGHQVISVSGSGDEIVSAAREGRLAGAEIMITDYRINGRFNGLEVAKIITKYYPHIRVIIASTEDGIERKAIAEGYSFLLKPFSFDKLREYVGM